MSGGIRIVIALFCVGVMVAGCDSALRSGSSSGSGSSSAAGSGVPTSSRSLPAVASLADVTSPHGPVFGVSVPDPGQQAIDRLSQQWGIRPRWVQIFASVLGLDSQQLEEVAGQVILSLEPWHPGGAYYQSDFRLVDTVSGRWDPQYRSIARKVAGYGKPIMIRWAHEMNGYWYPWGTVGQNTPSDYQRAWRHVVQVFRDEGATNVLWVWSPNIPRGTRGTSLKAFYPGDEWVDLVGLTGYGVQERSPENTYKTAIRQINSFTAKPLILTEVGVQSDAKKARWIREFGPWLRSHPSVVGFVWMERTPGTGVNADWRFDDTSEHLRLFRQSIRTAHVIGGVTSGPARANDRWPGELPAPTAEP